MRQFRLSELAALSSEIQRQMAIEELNEHRNRWAALAATVINSASMVSAQVAGLGGRRRRVKLVTADDIIGKDAKKLLQRLLQDDTEPDGWSRHIEDAKAKGLQGPWG